MNLKIKKAVEAVLKNYFEDEVTFDESEITEVIDAATSEGAVDMMNRSMDYVYRTEVKVNDVPVTQEGFRQLAKLDLYEVDCDLEEMRLVPEKMIRLGECINSSGAFGIPIKGTDGVSLTSYIFSDVMFLTEYGKIVRATEYLQEYDYNGNTIEVCNLKKSKDEYILLDFLKNYLEDGLSELCDNMFKV